MNIPITVCMQRAVKFLSYKVYLRIYVSFQIDMQKIQNFVQFPSEWLLFLNLQIFIWINTNQKTNDIF